MREMNSKVLASKNRLHINFFMRLTAFAVVILFWSQLTYAVEYYPDAADHAVVTQQVVSVCEGGGGGAGCGVVRGVVPCKRSVCGVRKKKIRRAAGCPVRKPRAKKKAVAVAAVAPVAPVIEATSESSCDGSTIIITADSQWSLKCFRRFLRGDIFTTDPLPTCFKVFVDEKGVPALHFSEGSEERLIPVVNLFKRAPGCYIACYSHNPDKQVYSVASNIYMIGHIRVRGSYDGQMCVPENFENKDIRGEDHFKELCSKSFSCIGNSCWAGGLTGTWFGL